MAGTLTGQRSAPHFRSDDTSLPHQEGYWNRAVDSRQGVGNQPLALRVTASIAVASARPLYYLGAASVGDSPKSVQTMNSAVEKPPSEKLTFQYWSDPMCIWAFVGQSKLDRVLEEWGDRIEVDYRIVPVFGSVSKRFEEGSWAEGGRAGRRETTCGIASEHGIEGVSGDVWVESEPHSSWACGTAAKAVFMMEEEGDAHPGAGADYLLEMRDHFYRRNRNICRRDEQLAVAERVGVDADGLQRRLDDGSALAAVCEDDNERDELGVRGSPTYVFEGGRAVLYGNFPFSVLHAVVEELLEGLEMGGSAC